MRFQRSVGIDFRTILPLCSTTGMIDNVIFPTVGWFNEGSRRLHDVRFSLLRSGSGVESCVGVFVALASDVVFGHELLATARAPADSFAATAWETFRGR